MTNRIALCAALLCLGAVVVDATLWDASHGVFLAKKLDALIEWLRFWR